jgi:pimeloyl-ACP methyl ester carboxylesterase
MAELKRIETAPGLVFDVLVDGPPAAPLVLLLHGFAESFHMWRSQLAALAAAGYRPVAPSQRGYSPGARPPTSEPANYQMDRLVGDAMALAAACGGADHRFHLVGDAMALAAACGGADHRFHLVGHDWGASIAWDIAYRYPERLASLAVLSRPHPNAFNRALAQPDGEQARRSQHHTAFLAPDAAPRLLADDARWLRERLANSGVPAAAIERHVAVLGNPLAMEAALTWYRARGAIRAPIGAISVPVLYIWGDADDTVGRTAAEGTRDFVSGSYRFEVLPGIGHFAADQAPERVNELLLAHLAEHQA